MPPTKKFPKYWVVDIQKNANHKLLPKFNEWFVKSSGEIRYFTIGLGKHWTNHFYGYDGDNRYYNGYYFSDYTSAFIKTPTIITLKEWNNHFFPNKQERKEIPFKKIKETPQYKTQKALTEHYESLFNTAAGELRLFSILADTLVGALDEIVAITNDNLAKKVAQMAKELYETDKLIHERMFDGVRLYSQNMTL